MKRIDALELERLNVQCEMLMVQRLALIEIAKGVMDLESAQGIATNDAFTVMLSRLAKQAGRAIGALV